MNMKSALKVFEFGSIPEQKEIVEEDFRNRFNQLRTAKSMSSTEEDKARYQGKVADLICARDALFDHFRQDALLGGKGSVRKGKTRSSNKAKAKPAQTNLNNPESTNNPEEESDFDFFLSLFLYITFGGLIAMVIVFILLKIFD